jgi:nucleoside-diphosphate-sugar epimerase
MARFLIAGCGYVGTALAEGLVDEGHEVFALRRTPARASAIHWIRADLTEIDTLRDLPPRLDHVCYLASAGGTDDRAYRSAYVDGVRYLLAALDGRTIRRFLYASSTGVYAQTDGERVDEESPAEPRHFSGLRLLEGERLVRRARVSTTIVRFSGIYGPGRTRLVDGVRRGEAVIPAGAAVYANRIHRDDCAGVLRHLSFLDTSAPLYLASDHDPADTATVLRWLAERLSAPPPRVGERRGPAERYGRASNKRVDNARLLASGYRFRYPTFREGYGSLIAAAGAAGS